MPTPTATIVTRFRWRARAGTATSSRDFLSLAKITILARFDERERNNRLAYLRARPVRTLPLIYLTFPTAFKRAAFPRYRLKPNIRYGLFEYSINPKRANLPPTRKDAIVRWMKRSILTKFLIPILLEPSTTKAMSTWAVQTATTIYVHVKTYKWEITLSFFDFYEFKKSFVKGEAVRLLRTN